MADPWQEPTTVKWAQHVLDEMAPMLRESSLMISLFAGDQSTGDVKYWVELGASICFDKPILVVVLGDAEIPTKLKLVADEIVRLPEGVDMDASEELQKAVARMVGNL